MKASAVGFSLVGSSSASSSFEHPEMPGADATINSLIQELTRVQARQAQAQERLMANLSELRAANSRRDKSDKITTAALARIDKRDAAAARSRKDLQRANIALLKSIRKITHIKEEGERLLTCGHVSRRSERDKAAVEAFRGAIVGGILGGMELGVGGLITGAIIGAGIAAIKPEGPARTKI